MFVKKTIAAFLMAIALVSRLPADDGIQLETDSVAKDYSAELPRVPPTEPADSLSKIDIVDGFDVQLAAHEPTVFDPIEIAFDEFGKLFVVCMRGYSEDPDDHLGAVRMLEDTDNDGVFDRFSNYIDGLSWPTAIACYRGGLFVGVPPDIIYCKDTDGDGRADIRQTVFTGFGRQNVQGMMNSFRWGLDNRLYGAGGLNGGTIKTLASDTTRDVAPLSLRGRDFSIDPDQRTIRPESGGAQHGLTFDRWGDRYVCSNSDHLQWIRFEDRHLRRNQLLSGFMARKSIAIDGPAAEVFRSSQVEPWRIVRTRLRVKGMVRGPVEGGGRPAGYFTSASGVTSYLGDAFPAKFRNEDFIFVGDVGSNLVHLKRIETRELEKIAVRATPPKTEFMTSTDNWFRPVQFANGPDGALYVIDMYREVIEHPLSLPPMIKKHLDLTSGRDRGRIYRVVPHGFKRSPRPLPGRTTPEQLVHMLGHDNGWHRETAARLIVSRSLESPEVTDRFTPLLREACLSDSPLARIRAGYCLRSLNRLTDATLLRLLSDSHVQVRRHAVRLVEGTRRPSSSVTKQLETMVEDPSPLVRYELALIVGDFEWDIRAPFLVSLARQASSPRMEFAVLSSMANYRFELARLLLENADWARDARLLNEIALEIGKESRECKAAVQLFASQSAPIRFSLVGYVLLGTGRHGQPLVRQLVDRGVENAVSVLQEEFEVAKTVALDETASERDRQFAIQILCLDEFDRIRPVLTRLLDPRQPATIRNVTIQQLGHFESPQVAHMLLQVALTLPPEGRRHAFELLTSRPTWADTLLRWIEEQKLLPDHIAASDRDRLIRHRDQQIAKRAQKVLGQNEDREKVIDQFQEVLSRHGDVGRGRQLFQKVCATCHRLDEFGSEVGPDLQPLRNRGAAFFLTNILDPNREIDPRYQAYTVTTTDGLAITGMVVSDDANAITLRQPDDKTIVIRKENIDTMLATGRSLMPEGLERDLGAQGIADVIAYLLQPPDAPPTGSTSN